MRNLLATKGSGVFSNATTTTVIFRHDVVAGGGGTVEHVAARFEVALKQLPLPRNQNGNYHS